MTAVSSPSRLRASGKRRSPRPPAPPLRGRVKWWGAVAAEVVILLALWELAVGTLELIDPEFFPPPSAIVGSLADLASGGRLLPHLLFSLQSFAIGYLLAVVLGITLGIMLGGSPLLNLLLGPFVWVLYATPKVAFAPLLVLWLGFGVESKVFMVLFMAIFPIIVNTVEGLQTVDPSLLRAGRVYGAGRLALTVKVILPSMLPFVLVGLQVGIVRGFIGVVIGEFMGSTQGLGILLSQSASMFQMADALAVVAILILLSNSAMGILMAVKRVVAPWHKPGGDLL
ncbi:ABC transporter permease [Rhizohabitans arisaemae]|uniref:ABC transporter permease n=1 Tax=Rhizohabitans arisaemae TaxID=2720610 RepID=UPI0024B16704|nr:ABC transporter permease [Rhizohabitans arisaemae]